MFRSILIEKKSLIKSKSLSKDSKLIKLVLLGLGQHRMKLDKNPFPLIVFSLSIMSSSLDTLESSKTKSLNDILFNFN